MSSGGQRPRAREDPLPSGDPWVLVVEDDAKFGDLVSRALGRAGLGAVVADTGDAALRAMRIGPPMSAAVVDVMIPHPDGIEVCRHLRRCGWTIPVVAISARSSPTDRARVEAAGADAFLSKPFALADLTDLVRRLMARRGPRTSDPIDAPPDS